MKALGHVQRLKSRPLTATTTLALTCAVALWPHDARAQATVSPHWSDEDVPTQPLPYYKPPASPAPYELPAARFGSPGQVVFTNAWVASLSSDSYSNSQASSFSASADLGFDCFVVRNLSLGADVDAGYSNQTGYGSDGSVVTMIPSSVSGGPRLGFNVPSWGRYGRSTRGRWSRSDGGIAPSSSCRGSSASIAGSPNGALTSTVTGPSVSLYAPLLLHLAPHFFIGFGPTVGRFFGSASEGPDVGVAHTDVGAAFEVGAYVGGRPPPPPADAGPHGPARRFGDEGEIRRSAAGSGRGAHCGRASTARARRSRRSPSSPPWTTSSPTTCRSGSPSRSATRT